MIIEPGSTVDDSHPAAASLFENLIGQPMAVSLLTSALRQQRLAPAYLFSGPDGVGRRLAAVRFLEGMLNSCQSSLRERRRLEGLNHPDLLWVEPTYQHQGRLIPESEAEEAGVSRRSPPQVRLEQIRGVTRFLARQPVEASRSMVVLEAAEAMPESAANALLKTLEEPGRGLLILLCAKPERLLATIRSRCQQIPFTRLDPLAMQAVLSRVETSGLQSLSVDSAEKELLVLAAGSPGALLAHQQTWQAVPEELRSRLRQKPRLAMEALALARDLTEVLNGEQQLWLIEWWEHYLWSVNFDPSPLQRLQKLRRHLLSFVQPRLAWEVALLELIESD